MIIFSSLLKNKKKQSENQIQLSSQTYSLDPDANVFTNECSQSNSQHMKFHLIV